MFTISQKGIFELPIPISAVLEFRWRGISAEPTCSLPLPLLRRHGTPKWKADHGHLYSGTDDETQTSYGKLSHAFPRVRTTDEYINGSSSAFLSGKGPGSFFIFKPVQRCRRLSSLTSSATPPSRARSASPQVSSLTGSSPLVRTAQPSSKHLR